MTENMIAHHAYPESADPPLNEEALQGSEALEGNIVCKSVPPECKSVSTTLDTYLTS